MDSSIIVAVITGLFAVLGQALIAGRKSKEDEIRDAQREQRQNDRMDRVEEKIGQLEKKVDIHNGYAEKFGDIQKSIAVIETKLSK